MGFSLVVARRGCCLVGCTGFPLRGMVSRVCGLQELQFPGPRAQAQELWLTGSVPPQLVGSSRARDRTCLLRWQAGSFPLGHQGGPTAPLDGHQMVFVLCSSDSCKNSLVLSLTGGVFGPSHGCF